MDGSDQLNVFLPESAGGPAPAFRQVEGCNLEVLPPMAMVIFGASGDLSKRKLFPSLYRLFKNGMLADRFFVLGTSRVGLTTSEFRDVMHDAVKTALGGGFDEALWDRFAGRL